MLRLTSILVLLASCHVYISFPLPSAGCTQLNAFHSSYNLTFELRESYLFSEHSGCYSICFSFNEALMIPSSMAINLVEYMCSSCCFALLFDSLLKQVNAAETQTHLGLIYPLVDNNTAFYWQIILCLGPSCICTQPVCMPHAGK